MYTSAAKSIWCRYDINLLPLILKPFAAEPTHMMNIAPSSIEIHLLSTETGRVARILQWRGHRSCDGTRFSQKS